eukprot:gene10757-17838_t
MEVAAAVSTAISNVHTASPPNSQGEEGQGSEQGLSEGSHSSGGGEPPRIRSMLGARSQVSTAISIEDNRAAGSAIQPERSLDGGESALSAAEQDVAGPSRQHHHGLVAPRPGNSLISTAVQPQAASWHEQYASSPKPHRPVSVVSQNALHQQHQGQVPMPFHPSTPVSFQLRGEAHQAQQPQGSNSKVTASLQAPHSMHSPQRLNTSNMGLHDPHHMAAISNIGLHDPHHMAAVSNMSLHDPHHMAAVSNIGLHDPHHMATVSNMGLHDPHHMAAVSNIGLNDLHLMPVVSTSLAAAVRASPVIPASLLPFLSAVSISPIQQIQQVAELLAIQRQVAALQAATQAAAGAHTGAEYSGTIGGLEYPELGLGGSSPYGDANAMLALAGGSAAHGGAFQGHDNPSHVSRMFAPAHPPTAGAGEDAYQGVSGNLTNPAHPGVGEAHSQHNGRGGGVHASGGGGMHAAGNFMATSAAFNIEGASLSAVGDPAGGFHQHHTLQGLAASGMGLGNGQLPVQDQQHVGSRYVPPTGSHAPLARLFSQSVSSSAPRHALGMPPPLELAQRGSIQAALSAAERSTPPPHPLTDAHQMSNHPGEGSQAGGGFGAVEQGGPGNGSNGQQGLDSPRASSLNQQEQLGQMGSLQSPAIGQLNGGADEGDGAGGMACHSIPPGLAPGMNPGGGGMSPSANQEPEELLPQMLAIAGDAHGNVAEDTCGDGYNHGLPAQSAIQGGSSLGGPAGRLGIAAAAALGAATSQIISGLGDGIGDHWGSPFRGGEHRGAAGGGGVGGYGGADGPVGGYGNGGSHQPAYQPPFMTSQQQQQRQPQQPGYSAMSNHPAHPIFKQHQQHQPPQPGHSVMSNALHPHPTSQQQEHQPPQPGHSVMSNHPAHPISQQHQQHQPQHPGRSVMSIALPAHPTFQQQEQHQPPQPGHSVMGNALPAHPTFQQQEQHQPPQPGHSVMSNALPAHPTSQQEQHQPQQPGHSVMSNHPAHLISQQHQQHQPPQPGHSVMSNALPADPASQQEQHQPPQPGHSVMSNHPAHPISQQHQQHQPPQPGHSVMSNALPAHPTFQQQEQHQPPQPGHSVMSNALPAPPTFQQHEQHQPPQPGHSVMSNALPAHPTFQQQEQHQPPQPGHSVMSNALPTHPTFQQQEHHQPPQPGHSVMSNALPAHQHASTPHSGQAHQAASSRQQQNYSHRQDRNFHHSSAYPALSALHLGYNHGQHHAAANAPAAMQASSHAAGHRAFDGAHHVVHLGDNFVYATNDRAATASRNTSENGSGGGDPRSPPHSRQHGTPQSHKQGGGTKQGEDSSGPGLASALGEPLEVLGPRHDMPGHSRGDKGRPAAAGRSLALAGPPQPHSEHQFPVPGGFEDEGTGARPKGLMARQGELAEEEEQVHPAASVHATVMAGAECMSEEMTEVSCMPAHGPGHDSSAPAVAVVAAVASNGGRPEDATQGLSHYSSGNGGRGRGLRPREGLAGTDDELEGRAEFPRAVYAAASAALSPILGPPDDGVGHRCASNRMEVCTETVSEGERGMVGDLEGVEPDMGHASNAVGGGARSSRGGGDMSPRMEGNGRDAMDRIEGEGGFDAGGASPNGGEAQADSNMGMATVGHTHSGTISGGRPTRSGTVDMSLLCDSQIANAAISSTEDGSVEPQSCDGHVDGCRPGGSLAPQPVGNLDLDEVVGGACPRQELVSGIVEAGNAAASSMVAGHAQAAHASGHIPHVFESPPAASVVPFAARAAPKPTAGRSVRDGNSCVVSGMEWGGSLALQGAPGWHLSIPFASGHLNKMEGTGTNDPDYMINGTNDPDYMINGTNDPDYMINGNDDPDNMINGGNDEEGSGGNAEEECQEPGADIDAEPEVEQQQQMHEAQTGSARQGSAQGAGSSHGKPACSQGGAAAGSTFGGGAPPEHSGRHMAHADRGASHHPHLGDAIGEGEGEGDAGDVVGSLAEGVGEQEQEQHPHQHQQQPFPWAAATSHSSGSNLKGKEGYYSDQNLLVGGGPQPQFAYNHNGQIPLPRLNSILTTASQPPDIGGFLAPMGHPAAAPNADRQPAEATVVGTLVDGQAHGHHDAPLYRHHRGDSALVPQCTVQHNMYSNLAATAAAAQLQVAQLHGTNHELYGPYPTEGVLSLNYLPVVVHGDQMEVGDSIGAEQQQEASRVGEGIGGSMDRDEPAHSGQGEAPQPATANFSPSLAQLEGPSPLPLLEWSHLNHQPQQPLPYQMAHSAAGMHLHEQQHVGTPAVHSVGGRRSAGGGSEERGGHHSEPYQPPLYSVQGSVERGGSHHPQQSHCLDQARGQLRPRMLSRPEGSVHRGDTDAHPGGVAPHAQHHGILSSPDGSVQRGDARWLGPAAPWEMPGGLAPQHPGGLAPQHHGILSSPEASVGREAGQHSQLHQGQTPEGALPSRLAAAAWPQLPSQSVVGQHLGGGQDGEVGDIDGKDAVSGMAEDGAAAHPLQEATPAAAMIIVSEIPEPHPVAEGGGEAAAPSGGADAAEAVCVAAAAEAVLEEGGGREYSEGRHSPLDGSPQPQMTILVNTTNAGTASGEIGSPLHAIDNAARLAHPAPHRRRRFGVPAFSCEYNQDGGDGEELEGPLQTGGGDIPEVPTFSRNIPQRARNTSQAGGTSQARDPSQAGKSDRATEQAGQVDMEVGRAESGSRLDAGGADQQDQACTISGVGHQGEGQDPDGQEPAHTCSGSYRQGADQQDPVPTCSADFLQGADQQDHVRTCSGRTCSASRHTCSGRACSGFGKPSSRKTCSVSRQQGKDQYDPTHACHDPADLPSAGAVSPVSPQHPFLAPLDQAPLTMQPQQGDMQGEIYKEGIGEGGLGQGGSPCPHTRGGKRKRSISSVSTGRA